MPESGLYFFCPTRCYNSVYLQFVHYKCAKFTCKDKIAHNFQKYVPLSNASILYDFRVFFFCICICIYVLIKFSEILSQYGLCQKIDVEKFVIRSGETRACQQFCTNLKIALQEMQTNICLDYALPLSPTHTLSSILMYVNNIRHDHHFVCDPI